MSTKDDAGRETAGGDRSQGRDASDAGGRGVLLAELVGTSFLVHTGTATAVAAATGRSITGAAADSLSRGTSQRRRPRTAAAPAQASW